MRDGIKIFFIVCFAIVVIGFPIAFTVWLDWLLKPKLTSATDEGIYIGMLLMGIFIEVVAFHVIAFIGGVIAWIARKLKQTNYANDI